MVATSSCHARFWNMHDVGLSHAGTMHMKVRERVGSSGCCASAEPDAFCGRFLVLAVGFVSIDRFQEDPLEKTSGLLPIEPTTFLLTSN